MQETSILLQKTCIKCLQILSINLFSFRKDTQKYRNTCKLCKQIYYKNYSLNNKDNIKEVNNLYYLKNKDKILKKKKEYCKKRAKERTEYNKIYYLNNKISKSEYNKIYNIKNKDKISKVKREYVLNNKNKINELAKRFYNKNISNINFKLRKRISYSVWFILKNNNFNKNNQSCVKYLPYTIEELKNHLESLFETWMNWDNWGIYNPKTWDDNDKSTWTWQIDHIVPQSDLPYTSMEEENFKKCWELSNLRPYSAKQNIIDGICRTRHKK